MTKTDTFTVPEFAEEMGVDRNTVTKWVRSGLVKGFKKDPFQRKTSPILIPKSELPRLKKLMEEAESKERSKSS